MAILFKIIRNGNEFSATADGGPAFFVGRRVPYEGNIGLYNIFGGSKLQKLNYAAVDFPALGFWAELVEPTAICEGRNFLTLNTYDSARFTFGFGQFAAHVPNGDFVKYFRKLLSLPQAGDYFPHLAVVNGRISATDFGTAPKPLESDDSTALLMAYLNPDLGEVQDAEVIAAAKLIHWTAASAAARQAQVGEMADSFKSFMVRADTRVGIDGLGGDRCCVIADILHHGRGGKMTWPLIHDALKAAKPFEALIAIGAPKWEERKKTLKAAVLARPNLAAHHWSRAKGDFA
jgi:hypothetical protein